MHVCDFLMGITEEKLLNVCVPNLQLLPFAGAQRMLLVSTLLFTQMSCITFVFCVFFPPLLNSRFHIFFLYAHISCLWQQLMTKTKPTSFFLFRFVFFVRRTWVLIFKKFGMHNLSLSFVSLFVFFSHCLTRNPRQKVFCLCYCWVEQAFLYVMRSP